jgi:hypothetical protein
VGAQKKGLSYRIRPEIDSDFEFLGYNGIGDYDSDFSKASSTDQDIRDIYDIDNEKRFGRFRFLHKAMSTRTNTISFRNTSTGLNVADALNIENLKKKR